MFRSEVITLDEVKWDGESNVEFSWNNCTCWSGAKRKDFWMPNEEWEERIKTGSCLRLWTSPNNSVVGFELKGDDKQWIPVWCIANNFRTKKEREANEASYDRFIEVEGKRIANMIDEGLSYGEIRKKISKGHSGNTFACALSIGIDDAENKENADNVRKEHNMYWGYEGINGLVNPAILSFRV